MEIVRLKIPAGECGTDETVRVIRQLIESGKRSYEIRKIAEWILKLYQVPARCPLAEIAAIHRWAKTNIRYLQDPYHVEYVQTPKRILVSRTGDCDDFTVLVGSLVEAIGYPVDIKVVAKGGRKNFHHVYPVARIGAESIGLDASMPVPLGYESPEVNRSKTYRSESMMLDVFGNMDGLGYVSPVTITRSGKMLDPKVSIVPTETLPPVDVTTMIPKFVRGVSTLPGNTLLISPGNPLRDYYVRKLFDRGFFTVLPGSSLIVVDFPGGISEVSARPVIVPSGNDAPIIYPPPPDDTFGPTEGVPLPPGFVGPGGMRRAVPMPIVPTEGVPLPPGFVGPGGMRRAVPMPMPIEAAPRYERPVYDTYGQPTAAPVVVTAPGAPAAGMDITTMAMIGGGLLLLVMLMRK